ncbi:hypothetical protein PROFUN_00108 [Planoprotostelium fungivorum]|uniref:Uncharacterized protein n=1 Tax=Planoprotostelium fungivorum TaxID=1890364 RepID=A0A2P6P0N1_9EUKA|nr:hypothetical protein PROFUN_00108 [Planoprotostelium fungivorum]
MDREPLVAEGLQLSILEKEQVLQTIIDQYTKPVLFSTIVCGVIALKVVAVLCEDVHLLIFLSVPVLALTIFEFFSLGDASIASERQMEAGQLLEDQYIGSWKFQKDAWNDAVRYLFGWKRILWAWTVFAIGLLFVGLTSYVVFVVNLHTLSSDVITFATAIGPLLVISLFSSFLILVRIYPRNIRYSSTIHCCVLGRGSVYTLGTMYTLRPATAPSTSQSHNLLSVVLQEKTIEKMTMTLLCLEMKKGEQDRETVETLEMPVPDPMVQDVSRWMIAMARDYTDDVRDTRSWTEEV